MAADQRIPRILRVIGGIVLLAVVVPMVHDDYAGMPITLDGERSSVLQGSLVGEVARTSEGARPGRLLSAGSHRVLSATDGGHFEVLVNGRAAPLSKPVHRGDDIRVIPGADEVEPVREETLTVEPVPRAIGNGTVPKVVSAGASSVYLLTIGEVSGEVAATETVSVGVPAVVRMVPPDGAPVVALTFDDGPWPGQTEQVLAILRERNVPATFFMLGTQVQRAPDLARAVASEGHLLGNHTYWHVNLGSSRWDVAAWEIEATNQLIQSVTGVRPTWLRAPGGALRGPAHGYIAQAGMRSALWDVDPQDWREGQTPEAMAWAVISAAKPGAVVVLHDGGGDQSTTIAALPQIIDGLRYYGYEFVTLDELPSVRAGW